VRVKEKKLMQRINVKHVMEKKSSAKEKSSKFILTKVMNKIYSDGEKKMNDLLFCLGMEDGKKITFNGEGVQEPGLEPGDIIVVLDEKENGIFKRDKTDLHMKMQITLTESLCGFHKVIKTLDNRELVITSLPGKHFNLLKI
jgi:DnaJ-class molecular chaperone